MHSNSFFLPLLFNEVIGELPSCFMNLLLKSLFVFQSHKTFHIEEPRRTQQTHLRTTLLISVTIINQSVLRSVIKTSVKYEDSQHFVRRNLRTVVGFCNSPNCNCNLFHKLFHAIFYGTSCVPI